MNLKLIATLVFLGTLAFGVVAGIVIDRAWLLPPSRLESASTPRGAHRRSDHDHRGDLNLKSFVRQLDLTSVQQDTLDKILDNYRRRFETLSHDIHPRFHAIRDSLNVEIRLILTSTQQEKFDQMIRASEKKQHESP